MRLDWSLEFLVSAKAEYMQQILSLDMASSIFISFTAISFGVLLDPAPFHMYLQSCVLLRNIFLCTFKCKP